MQDQNIAYIRQHYLSFDEVSRQTGLSIPAIQDLIDKGLIPDASYTIEQQTVITSPLGDQTRQCSKTKYFPKGITHLIVNIIAQPEHAPCKAVFKQNFRRLLISHPDRLFAYGNIFGRDGELLEAEFEQAFESEWQAYTAGIYGICTLSFTEEDIVRKEIAVKKLIHFHETHNHKLLDEAEKQVFLELVQEFDTVAAPFAPYQRAASSRGKYVDSLLTQNGLTDLIKPYQHTVPQHT